jgi:hypothetical protein
MDEKVASLTTANQELVTKCDELSQLLEENEKKLANRNTEIEELKSIIKKNTETISSSKLTIV